MSNVNSMRSGLLCSTQWRRAVAGLALGAGALALHVATATIPGAHATTGQAGYAGVWLDDKGEGAVEIGPCAGRLCGRIVWLRSPVDRAGRPLTDGNNPDARQRQRPICGLPVIGDLKQQRAGNWDEGWIYDPRQGKQFDVALRLREADTLEVTGYLGIKLLSESFIWRRAPAELKRCG
jgi:uncharacterized protein (DUF2147 family)